MSRRKPEQMEVYFVYYRDHGKKKAKAVPTKVLADDWRDYYRGPGKKKFLGYRKAVMQEVIE